MEVLGEDSLGLGYIKIILSCLIRKQKPLFLYRIQQEIQNSCSSNIYQRIFSAANSHQGSFLKNIGYDIAKQARDRRQRNYTDEEIRTNYITLISVTLKDEIMRTLQK
jgi:hypothetical protein